MQSGHCELKTNTVPPSLHKDFARWINFQFVHGDVDSLFIPKQPRLEAVAYVDYGSKVNQIAQRHCCMCNVASEPEAGLPIYVFPIRITPISRQASRGDMFARFQAAFEKKFEDLPLRLEVQASA